MKNNTNEFTKDMIETFEIKKAKTGQAIPVINDVHLHSIYYPIREADALAKSNQSIISAKNKILILGLGFGYHVEAIVKLMYEIHNQDFEIYVVEPSREVIEEAKKNTSINFSHFKIINEENVESLFDNLEVINFLINRPGVIIHPASYNLWNNYYKRFLSFKASDRITDVIDRISDASLKEYLINHIGNAKTCNDIMLTIGSKPNLINNDFLLLTINEITRQSKTLTESVDNG